MEYLIGSVIALSALGMAAIVGLSRDRAFFPTVLMVIATYYVLFGVLGDSSQALILECLVAAVFIAVAVVGFKSSLWWIAAALAAHGLFDFTHHLFIDNPGMPGWWPGFCGTFDVVAAGIVAAGLILHSKHPRPL